MFVEVNGLRVNLERAGAGPPLLLLHGWGGSARSFGPLIPMLSRAFTVYAPDLPGFGLSSPPPQPWGVADYAGLVLGLLGRLDLKKAHVLGHSHGGRVSIALAAQPLSVVDRLVLVDSAGIRPPRTMALRTRGLIARTARRALGHPLAGRPGRRALAGLYRRLGMADYATAGELRATFVKVVNQDLSDLLPLIAAPTLVVWGAKDTETPLWMGLQMARDISRAKLVVLPGAGHYSYLDAQRRFEQQVCDFLTADIEA